MFWKKFFQKVEPKVEERFQVQPTISIKLKEEIERLAYILDQSIQNVGEILFAFGLNEREVVDALSRYFQKDFLIMDRTIFYGHLSNPSLQNAPIKGDTERISIRFCEDGEHDIELYSRLLGVSQSKSVAIILEYSIRHVGIVEEMIRDRNNRKHFDEVVLDEIKSLMRYINRMNPYKATWDTVFVQFIEGPQKRKNRVRKPMRDTETYRWSLD